MLIRTADDQGLSQVVALMPLYMSETYGAEWHGSEDAIRAAVAAEKLQVLTASRAERIAGFIAWTPAYDLHWCISGGAVADLYVRRGARGRAVALRLLAAAAASISRDGGAFLRGTAVDRGAGRKLYGRVAVCSSTTECTVGGRAFRQLAELENAPARELVERLPVVPLNYEP